jgi:2-polyprenyl-3-methyl-5-hydroxy-6-metoxy-1,4-benzoquinol methylase
VFLWIAASHEHFSFWFCLSCVMLLVATFFSTAWLVHRAEKRNQKNIAVALQELQDFTTYPPDRIRHLWATSNQQLAENWKEAAIAPDDSDRLAEWYRQNSELYLFAISGYNLEYKRIRATLNVLKLARGACLDYGAGNGEVLLELGKRGHAVAYYDVAGETMRFARLRAQQRRVPLMFFHSKEGLTRSNCHFDTIYALDVLEHLPDLAGELDFLSSLLKPGGLLVFDVPAGATKSHPMHLNHDLDVVTYLKARGLTDARTLRQRMPFRKEEKYFFRKPQAKPSAVEA